MPSGLAPGRGRSLAARHRSVQDGPMATTTRAESVRGVPAGSSTPGWRGDVLLAVIVLLLTAPLMHPLMAQQASRFAFTAALWEQRSVVIDEYEQILGVDYAERDGHLYSDKAPGQPFSAVPVYAVYRALGGEPGSVYRPYGNLGLWALELWSAALPAALLAVLMRRLAWRVSPRHATVSAVAVATATLLLPFATVLFSHVLSAFLVFLAYVMLRRGSPPPALLVASGFVAALAVTAEFSAAIAGFVLLGVAMARHRGRAGWFLAGGIPPAIFLGLYQWAAFGGPLTFSYEHAGTFGAHHEAGLVGVQSPDIGMLLQVLFGDRGLFFLTPVVLFGLVGAMVLLADRRRRDLAIVSLTTFTLYVLMMAGWSNATGGASPGPRYVVPALPFLVVGVAEAWRRWPWLGWASAAVGWLTMGIATYTLPLAPRDEPSAMAYWIQRARDGEWADTLLTFWGWDWLRWLPVVIAIGLVTWLLRNERAGSRS